MSPTKVVTSGGHLNFRVSQQRYRRPRPPTATPPQTHRSCRKTQISARNRSAWEWMAIYQEMAAGHVPHPTGDDGAKMSARLFLNLSLIHISEPTRPY